MDDDPRELLEEDAGEGPGPMARRRRALRWIALVTLVGMIVPGVLSTWAIARSTAEQSCRLVADEVAGARSDARVAFELTSLDRLGWNCYAESNGREVLIAVLGIIPGAARVPAGIPS